VLSHCLSACLTEPAYVTFGAVNYIFHHQKLTSYVCYNSELGLGFPSNVPPVHRRVTLTTTLHNLPATFCNALPETKFIFFSNSSHPANSTRRRDDEHNSRPANVTFEINSSLFCIAGPNVHLLSPQICFANIIHTD
jgi:hypothetical protein